MKKRNFVERNIFYYRKGGESRKKEAEKRKKEKVKMSKRKKSKKRQQQQQQRQGSDGSKRQYDKETSPTLKSQAPLTQFGSLPHDVITLDDEKPAQNQLTFRRLGILLMVAQIPLFVFAVLNILNVNHGFEWHPWVLWSPLYVGIIALLVVISALKFDTPFIAHITWNFILAVLEIYLVMLVVQEEYPDLRFWRYFPVYFPHWVISIVLFLIGVGILVKTALRRAKKGASSGPESGSVNGDEDDGAYPSDRVMLLSEEESSNQSTYFLASAGYIVVGLIWGVISLLTYLREMRVVEAYSLSWTVILLPWYIFDLFLFVCLVVMLVFSFGASQSSVFTINQQFIMIAITVISTFIKAMLNLKFEGTSPVPPNEIMSSILALCVGILLLGLCFATSRNKNTVICGKQAVHPVKYVVDQEIN